MAGCVTGAPFGGLATVTLGGGDDRLNAITSCTAGTVPEGGFSFRVVVVAGAGDDTVNGTEGGDRIDGGAGDDDLSGGGGNDAMGGGTGTDLVDGGDGDDTFCCSSSGSARIAGGPGIDTVTYSPTTARVGVTIGDDSNGDGLVGITNDKVQGSVENVTSGSGNDALVGNAAANALIGNAGADVLRGEGARTAWSAGTAGYAHRRHGVDTLEGAPGTTRSTRVTARTTSSPAARTDSLTLDLREPFPSFTSGCEGGVRFALDEAGPAW